MKKEKTITIERKVRRFNWGAFVGSIIITIFMISLSTLIWAAFYNATNSYNWSFISAGIFFWILMYILFTIISGGGMFYEETITEEIKIK